MVGKSILILNFLRAALVFLRFKEPMIIFFLLYFLRAKDLTLDYFSFILGSLVESL